MEKTKVMSRHKTRDYNYKNMVLIFRVHVILQYQDQPAVKHPIQQNIPNTCRHQMSPQTTNVRGLLKMIYSSWFF